MTTAPVALFAFNRPEHVRRTLESLSQNVDANQAELVVFLDGPRHERDEAQVRAVREVVTSRHWCKSVDIVVRGENWGCARSIIDGVTQLCRSAGRVIVVEDDLVLSRWFLEYMHTALQRYADAERVMQVSGYMFPDVAATETRAVLLPLPTSWGWATWDRAWRRFDPLQTPDGFARLSQDHAMRHRFDMMGSYPYFQMLQDQLRGRIDSWAIQWYLATFLQEGLTLFPARSLVGNFGFDGSGRHCGRAANGNARPPSEDRPDFEFPERIEVESLVYEAVVRHLYQLTGGFLGRMRRCLRHGW